MTFSELCISFIEQLFFIFNEILSIGSFGRCVHNTASYYTKFDVTQSFCGCYKKINKEFYKGIIGK